MFESLTPAALCVNQVMTNMGNAMMGSGEAEGDNR
jgi:cell division GTPase FtsZ